MKRVFGPCLVPYGVAIVLNILIPQIFTTAGEPDTVVLGSHGADAKSGRSSWDRFDISLDPSQPAYGDPLEQVLIEAPGAINCESQQKNGLCWPLWTRYESKQQTEGVHSCPDSKHHILRNRGIGHMNCWSIRADSLILWRNAPKNRALFTQGGVTVMDADQLESDVLASPRVSIFYTRPCGNAAEITYIYAGNFFSDQSTAVDGYASPGIYGLSTPAPTAASATLLGQLQSLEANGRTPIGLGSVSLIAGFRWIQWQEELRISTEPSQQYLTNCFNDLYGGQIGLDSLLYRSNQGIRLEGLVKAGAYYNSAVQHSSTNSTSVTAWGTPASASFAGEVGLTGVVPITCHWDFRLGYFGLWLESIAQPSSQLSRQSFAGTVPVGGLATNGSAVIQGVSLGVEGKW